MFPGAYIKNNGHWMRDISASEGSSAAGINFDLWLCLLQVADNPGDRRYVDPGNCRRKEAAAASSGILTVHGNGLCGVCRDPQCSSAAVPRSAVLLHGGDRTPVTGCY